MTTDLHPDTPEIPNDPFEARVRTTLHAAAAQTRVEPVARPAIVGVPQLDERRPASPAWWGLAAAATVALVLGVTLAVREPAPTTVVGPAQEGTGTTVPGTAAAAAAAAPSGRLPKLRFDYLPEGTGAGDVVSFAPRGTDLGNVTVWRDPESGRELAALVATDGQVLYQPEPTLPLAVAQQSDTEMQSVDINGRSGLLSEVEGMPPLVRWNPEPGVSVSLSGRGFGPAELVATARALTVPPVAGGPRSATLTPLAGLPAGLTETYRGPFDIARAFIPEQELTLTGPLSRGAGAVSLSAVSFRADTYAALLSSDVRRFAGQDGLSFVSGAWLGAPGMPADGHVVVGGTDRFTVFVFSDTLPVGEVERIAQGIGIAGWWSDTDQPRRFSDTVGSIPEQPAPGSRDIWPTAPPTDYCAGWREWMRVQLEAPGPASVQTEGFRRYVTQMADLAPGDLPDAYRRLRDIWLDPAQAGVDDGANGSGELNMHIYEVSQATCPSP